jgi:HEAT repeat protein
MINARFAVGCVAMDLTTKIADLLGHENPRKRIAAAVVIGELKIKDAPVVAALISMAKDPMDAYAEAAIETLGQLKSMKALPMFLDSLNRSKTLAAQAKAAIGELGEDALPLIRERLNVATPEARVLLSQLLPAVGGRESFEMALEGMRNQPWDNVNRVALSVRQEAKLMSDAERKVMKTQVEKFLAKKKTVEDETAFRGAIKILGFLEIPETQDLLLGFLGPKQPPLVRLEATTALRFALAKGPTKKALRKLIDILIDSDVNVGRAARDSLTVLKIGSEFSEELAELCASPVGEVALWAIRHLGELATNEKGTASKLATKTLQPVARSHEKARAEAACQVLAQLPGGEALLAEALSEAEDEHGAQVLVDVLGPLSSKLAKKEIKLLLASGQKNLAKNLAIARKQLEPVRSADPQAWADVLRDSMKALLKKDPARAEAIGNMLSRSQVATTGDKYSLIVQQFAHHNFDPHPRARQRDDTLLQLEKLQSEGFKIADALIKDKKISDEAKQYVGIHFAEKASFEFKNIGAEILEHLALGKNKIGKAAKNKLKLLGLKE